MSETVTISCPSCSKQYRIKAALARQTGKSAKCRACGSAIPLGVPQPAAAAPQPAQADQKPQSSASGATAVQLYRRGVSLAKSGKPREAVASFDAAIQLNPDLAEAHLGKGLCLKKLGDSRKSFASLRKASRLGNAKATQIIHRDLGFGDAPAPGDSAPAKAGKAPAKPKPGKKAKPGRKDSGEEPKTTKRKMGLFDGIRLLLILLIVSIFLYVIYHVYTLTTKNSSLEPAYNGLTEIASLLRAPIGFEEYAAKVNGCRDKLAAMDPGPRAKALAFAFEHYEAALNLWQAQNTANGEALIGGLNRAHQLLPRSISPEAYLEYRDALSLRLHLSEPEMDNLARLQQEDHATWVLKTSLEARTEERDRAVKELTQSLWVRAALILSKYQKREYQWQAPPVPPADIQAITRAMARRNLEDLMLSSHIHVLLTWLESTMAGGLATPDAQILSQASAAAWRGRQDTPVTFTPVASDGNGLDMRIVAQADDMELGLDITLPASLPQPPAAE